KTNLGVSHLPSPPAYQRKTGSLPLCEPTHDVRAVASVSSCWLQRNYDCSEVWYVVGANGKRYQFLYVDPESCRLGTRDDHFPRGTCQQYRRKDRDAEMSFRDQCREIGKEVFGPTQEFEAFHRKRLKKSYLGI